MNGFAMDKMNDYMLMNPYYFEELKNTDSKAEIKSYKTRIIEDIKKQEYPKGVCKMMVAYVRAM